MASMINKVPGMSTVTSGMSSVTSGVSSLNPFGGNKVSTDASSKLMSDCTAIVEERSTTKAPSSTISTAIRGTNSSRADVRFQGLLALVVLSENDANKSQIIDGNAMPAVFNAATSSDDKAQYAAARVMWHISKSEGHKQALVSNEGLAAISVVCMSLISHVQYAAARIMLHLSESEDMQGAIMSSDLPMKLADLICVDAEQVQYIAACAIQALADKQPGHPAFTNSAVLDKLMDLVKVGSDNCQYAAIQCLVSLARLETTLKELKAKNAIDLYVNVLSNSNNERVVYIAMTAIGEMRLNEFDMQDKLVQAGVMVSVASMLRSEKAILVKATANFIKGYANNVKVRDHVLENIGFEPFLKLLASPDPSLMQSATTILSALLKEDMARKQFVASDGMKSVSGLLKSEDVALQLTALMLLWSLILADENKVSIVQDGTLSVLAGLTEAPNFTVCFISALCICQTSTAKTVSDDVFKSDAVKGAASFAQFSDWKIHSDIEWQADDLVEIAGLVNSESLDVQRFGVWALSHVCTKPENRDLVARAGAVSSLNKIATSGTSDLADMANEALAIFDASVVPAPEDVGDRLTRYMEEIGKEKEICDKIISEHERVGAVVSTLDPSGFDGLEVTSKTLPEIAAKYREVLGKQSDIRGGQKSILAQLSGIGESMKMIALQRGGFERLSRKVEVKDRMDALNEKITGLVREQDTLNQSLGTLEAAKAEAEEALEKTNASVEDSLLERTKKEQRRIQLNEEIQDLKYQVENHGPMADEINAQLAKLQAQMDELVKAMEAIDVGIAEKAVEIEKIINDINDREANLAAFAELRKTVDKLKGLREELQRKFGAELSAVTEYHSLLDRLINDAFAKIKDMGREPPAIASEEKKFGPEDVAAATSYQQQKQAALDTELAAIEKDLKRGKDELEQLKRDAEGVFQSKNEEKRLLQEDIDKLKAQMDEINGKLDLLSDEEAMKYKLAELETELAAVMKALEDIDATLKTLDDAKRDQMSKLYETSGELRKTTSAITRISAELAAEKEAYKTMYSRLNAELTEFAVGLSAYVSKRAEVQAKLRPVQAALAEWTPLIGEERALKLEAADIADAAVADLQAQAAALRASELSAKVDEAEPAAELAAE